MIGDTTKLMRGHSHVWIIAVLIAINVLAYAAVWKHDYVNFDDPGHVYENPLVTAGLTWEGLVSAFATAPDANWQPLTWLSHMFVVEFFGLNPAAHHLTNVFLHILNTLLVFWVLYQLTAALGRSAFIAAVFAVHPLHVESVAWVAERKDVLSSSFWMLTILAYVHYVRQPRWTRYLAVVVLFGFGLMAKPMLVTLPFVLLLVDFWPLGRMAFKTPSNLSYLVREKIPLLALAVLSSIVTILVQNKGGSISSLTSIPMSTRVANAFVAYCTYIWKMFWPTDMVILYPLSAVPADWWLGAVAFVISVSIFALLMAQRRPYVPVGWFWFLGTLVPVIGIIQSGPQSMADRYTYIPLIGLFLIVTFAVAEVVGSRLKGPVLVSGAAIVIAACIQVTRTQLSYWKDGQTVWEHEIRVFDNPWARVSLGNWFAIHNKRSEAIPHYTQALRQEPDNAETHYVLAKVLSDTGSMDDAFNHYSEVIRLAQKGSAMNPVRLARAHYNVGLALATKGKPNEATAHFAEALRLNPNYPEASNDLGAQLFVQGKIEEAIPYFKQAIRLDPGYASAHNSLGTALANQGRMDDAIAEYSEAVRLVPGYAEAHTNLGILLATRGKTDEAIAHLSEAIRISPNQQAAQNWLADLKSKKVKTP